MKNWFDDKKFASIKEESTVGKYIYKLHDLYFYKHNIDYIWLGEVDGTKHNLQIKLFFFGFLVRCDTSKNIIISPLSHFKI